MTTQVTIVNTAVVKGPNAVPVTANLVAEMDPAVVPLPLAFLFGIGVGLSLGSDVVAAGGGNVTRTITLRLVPTVLPVVTATRDLSADGGPIEKLTIGNRGQRLFAPPLLVFGDSFVIPSGTLQGKPWVPPRSAIASTALRVRAAAVFNGGSGYTAPIATAVGGLFAGGKPATFTATQVMGVVQTPLTLVDPGGPYFEPPTIVITDSGMGTGSGAVADIPDMELRDAILDYGGVGYITPTVTVLPLFKKTWPDTLTAAQQAQPFINLIRRALEASTSSPIEEVVTVS
jgi:hypothetical protein